MKRKFITKTTQKLTDPIWSDHFQGMLQFTYDQKFTTTARFRYDVMGFILRLEKALTLMQVQVDFNHLISTLVYQVIIITGRAFIVDKSPRDPKVST